MALIFVRTDDLLVAGTKEYINNFHSKLSREPKLKIEGPLQCADVGIAFFPV